MAWTYWYYYPYAYFPIMPYDFMYLMTIMMWWMIIPYYYSLYFELFRTMIETWRKALEGLIKPSTTTTS